MPELPTGTVTLLFTDIEGSTRLLQQLVDRYASMLAECRLCWLLEISVQEIGLFRTMEIQRKGSSRSVREKISLWQEEWSFLTAEAFGSEMHAGPTVFFQRSVDHRR